MSDLIVATQDYAGYRDLFFRLQLAQWENYAALAKHDLVGLDDAIYKYLQETDASSDCQDREKTIYQAIRKRGLIDKQPAVATLRNRLDDWGNYCDQNQQSQSEQRLAVARRMRPDILELMRLRNQLARQQGCSSYPEFVMQAEELDLHWVCQQTLDYLNRNLEQARQLIVTNRINWNSWFADLARLGPSLHHAVAQELARELLQRLGLLDALPRISILVKEGMAGYTGVISPGADVRILVRPLNSLSCVRTFCHELGHALCHSLNNAKGLAQTWTGSYDEVMAVLVERIGVQLLLPAAYQQACEIALLENVRCAISFLFELELWQRPEQAEELYLKHYGLLGLEVAEPELWTLDSFRSVDPVYIQNYVLGATISEQVLAQLHDHHGDNHQAWGNELRSLFRDGRERPLLAKIKIEKEAF